jgi:hypothetical protein
MNQNYIDTIRLLLAIAPAVLASGRFAMKGGTALNLFVQEMPRLSVDIDLVFVDHRPDRQAALHDIAMELAAVQATLTRQGYRAHLPATAQGDDVKLVVSNGATQVKVEVNVVFRGTALPVEHHSLVDSAQNLSTTDRRRSGPGDGRALRQQACRGDGSSASARHLRRDAHAPALWLAA